jgi:uncharacterized membrane protein YfcA
MILYVLLFGAALGAGLMNSIAGGGSFLTFPALVFAGVPSIIANASSTVGLIPGVFASAWAYRHHFKPLKEVSFKTLFVVSIAGGITGAQLLLHTSQGLFDVIIPWLLLLATFVFSFGKGLSSLLQRRVRIGPKTVIVAQFLVSVYGGYFGGAVGIMMLALWSLLGTYDIHALNANRTLLGGSMNCAAVVLFIIAGKVWWLQTLIILAGSVTGGYLGARFARRMNPLHVRRVVTAISVLVTVIFFARL